MCKQKKPSNQAIGQFILQLSVLCGEFEQNFSAWFSDCYHILPVGSKLLTCGVDVFVGCSVMYLS